MTLYLKETEFPFSTQTQSSSADQAIPQEVIDEDWEITHLTPLVDRQSSVSDEVNNSQEVQNVISQVVPSTTQPTEQITVPDTSAP